ncbi:MAG: ribosome small subunit-dependent GTPase A [Verrucomicrobia bacterium]|nr:ribosome small subunit-dependent GTPase A [Verrucomicrobiota bacterium]
MGKDDEFYHLEEDFYSKDRKAHRKERKMASSKDRSKYKKSDQDQLKKHALLRDEQPIDESLEKGRVLAIAPEGIIVDYNGEELICSLKGSLKQEKNRAKNLIAVGDFVRFENKGSGQGTISFIEERHSILSRADNLSRNKEQLIAVNIDQVLITCSVVQPMLKPPLVDRYIIAALKGNMKPIIVVNKIDLFDHPPETVSEIDLEVEKEIYAQFLKAYAALDIPVISISTSTGEGIESLRALMQGKTSVFSGQSGVGKSSLINLVAGTTMRTGSVVQKTGKGSHTTTTTHLIPLECGGFCIDTPGIRSFGLWDLKKEEVVDYFPEIVALSPECRYPDCAHMTEPDCAVQKALEEERISSLRFESYCALIASVSQQHRLR